MYHAMPRGNTETDENLTMPDENGTMTEPGRSIFPNPGEALHERAAPFADYVLPRNRLEEAWINTAKAITLPQPLWREMPDYWFKVVEATFLLHRVTSDDTKYRHVLPNLDPTVMPFVADIISNPPEHKKYEHIKKRIIDAFGESQEANLRKLLRGQEMIGEKPSHFLQRLRNLAGGQCTNSVIRSLFLEQLPESVRGILAISPTEDLSVLALQANRIIEVIKPQIATIKSENNTNVVAIAKKTQVNSVEEELQQLKLQVQQLTLAKNTRRQPNKNKNYFGRRRSRSRSRGE